MELFTGKNVRIKHFAGKYCNKGEVTETAGSIVTIKPEKAFTVFSFFEEDPIVLIYDHNERYYVCQCSIISIDYVSSTFNILVESNEEFNNRRQDYRYPTSLYGIALNSPSKETIFINNISTGGINLRSKLDLPVNETVELEATLDGYKIFIRGHVKWKKEQNKFYEYGIFAEETNPDVEKMMDIIKRDHLLTVRSLKYEKQLLNSF